MKGFWCVAIGAISYVILSAGHAYAEVWSCAIADKTGWADIEQYRLEGNVLKNLTQDKTWHEILQETDKSKFLGSVYNVLLDNNDALIAELDSTKPNSNKERVIYVSNIIIGKETGHLIKTTILSHLPDQIKLILNMGHVRSINEPACHKIMHLPFSEAIHACCA